jgi:hypothetical protein
MAPGVRWAEDRAGESRLDKQGPDLQAALTDLFQRKAITAWYWGHEHECLDWVWSRLPSGHMTDRHKCQSPEKATQPQWWVTLAHRSSSASLQIMHNNYAHAPFS